MTTPRVSIVTTVFDRLECLSRCLRAIARSEFTAFEQIVVSDHPGPGFAAAIADLVRQAGPCVRHLDLPARANDWGMTPAYAGLKEACGEYVCFLSDDNAYLPGHLTPLVAMLDDDPGLGFVYSSCLYAGRTVLAVAPPKPSQIDLGQPLFRRRVLFEAFPAGLPFKEFAWDWRMIAALLARGVRWQHHDAKSFVFRLAAYPHLQKALA